MFLPLMARIAVRIFYRLENLPEKRGLQLQAEPVIFTLYASSFVVRIRLMPAMKKIRPSMPKMTSDLISRSAPDLLTNITAA
jgi:hypothetical protein